MFGIVIDKTTNFVLDKCVVISEYEPQENEEVVPYEYELGNPVGNMNKPQLVNGEWIDTEPLPPIEVPPSEPTQDDKISIRLDQQEMAIGILATQVAKNTLLK